MFELNGYWQRVGGITFENTVQKYTSEAVCPGAFSGRVGLDLSTREMERWLVVPTFIRQGRKIAV